MAAADHVQREPRELVRDRVLDEIAAKDLQMKFMGTVIDIKRTRLKSATDRNNSLKAAEKLTKQVLGGDGVEILWEERALKFQDEVVFQQPSGQSLGTFFGKMEGKQLE